LLLINIGLLALVFVPGIGITAGGAQRWVSIGAVSFQPSEMLKLTFVLYLASWLVSRTRRSTGCKCQKKVFGETYFAFLAAVGVIGLLLIMQPDVSTFGIIALTACCMYFLSDTPLKHTIYTLMLGVICLMVLVYFKPYRIDRFIAWMFPEIEPMGDNFQPTQALIAIGRRSV